MARARLQLTLAMGVEADQHDELESMLTHQTADVQLVKVIHASLTQRQELSRLEAQRAALKAKVSASKRGAYPTVFGRLGYRIEGEGAEQPGFIVGVGVQIPLFEGYANVAKVKESQATLRRSEAELATAKQLIVVEVRQAHLNLVLAEERIQITELPKQSAADNLRAVREKARIGRASAIELAEAETLAASTRIKHLQSIYQYQISMAQLERAMGRNVKP